jgi:CheY-like chemotaxis protein
MSPDSTKRILVVEDDPDILEALVDLLSEEGYSVSTAENGQLALDFLHSSETLPSVILLDLMMPVKDGKAFRAEQRADPRLGSIPVILMSADGRAESRSSEYGFDHYIRKPADVSTILEMVARFMAKT